MPRSDALVDHCIELMSPLGRVTARRMFGGHGLRIDELFVGLIAFERLYLKTDAATQPRFAGAGCEPFVYHGKTKPVTMSYWSVPAEAMEAPEQMRPWALLAIEAALRARQPPKPARTAKRPARR
jgi:DNA transformation protein